MGVNAFIEPLVVISLLVGGTWVNRDRSYKLRLQNSSPKPLRLSVDEESLPGSPTSFNSKDGLLTEEFTSPISRPCATDASISTWRIRKICFFGFRKTLWTHNTKVFEDRWFSRVIRKFPFLREVWYWALIYWVNCPSPRSSHF